MGKLPDRPPWYREMMAGLRAERSAGDVSPSEFLELAADEIQKRHDAGDPFGRSLWISDAAAYDRAVRKEQVATAEEIRALEDAAGYLKPSLFPDDVLIKLGLEQELELGFGRTVKTLDATHDERLKAVAELERKLGNANLGIHKRIDHLKHADELARDKTLREIIADPEEYGYDTGT
jgi:hypothetical protein